MRNIYIKKALHIYCVVLFSMRKISSNKKYIQKIYEAVLLTQFYHNSVTNLREKIKRTITYTSNSPTPEYVL